jgi:hypothetical protein
LLRSGIHENQIVAVRKTSPHRRTCPCEGIHNLFAGSLLETRLHLT